MNIKYYSISIKVWPLLSALVLWHSQVLANSIILTLYETQWQQSGYPVNASKWQFTQERKLSYAINEQASAGSKELIRKALETVSAEARIEFVPSTDSQGTAQMVFEVSRYSDEQLRSMPCDARIYDNAFVIRQVRIRISEQQAYRCTLHELMHGFGLRGHPSGDTVLSYFEGNRSGLKEIDTFLLKHWNSDLITPGMNVFRVTEVLGNQWIEEKVPAPEQAKAREEQRAWFQKTVAQMDAFADGQGEPPAILYRSGRLSDSGVKHSRAVIQGILGVAHLEGYGTPRNPARARDLLLGGVKNHLLGARTALLRALAQNKFEGTAMAEVCGWMKDTPLAQSKLSQAQVDEALASKACASP